MKSKKTTATLCALMAQIIFGFSFMFTKISIKTASPLVVIFDRHLVALFAMTLALLGLKVKFKINRSFWKLILMSVFQPFLYFIFETYGIDMTTSSFSSVMIALIPVVSMVLGIFILKEKPAFLQYVFMLISVVGVVIVAYAGKTDGSIKTFGILLLFGAVVSSVGYNIMSRKISSEFSAFERTYAMMLVGILSFGILAFIENLNDPVVLLVGFSNPEYLFSILYLGVVSSVLAFLLLNFANTHLPVAKTTVFSNITTVVSVSAGAVFLNEKFTMISLLSCAMIIIGVWGVQILDIKSKK